MSKKRKTDRQIVIEEYPDAISVVSSNTQSGIYKQVWRTIKLYSEEKGFYKTLGHGNFSAEAWKNARRNLNN